jgi:hypothetical protein
MRLLRVHNMWKTQGRLCWAWYAFVCVSLSLLVWAGELRAEDRWSAGLDGGFWGATVDGTVLAVGGNVDYHPTKLFSVGGMVLLAPGSDLTQVAMAGVVRYYYYTRWGAVVPFAGLGFIHANLSASSPTARDASSTSHYVPLGVTVQYQVARKLALATTALVNLHAINLREAGQSDATSFALLFGVRFGP